MQTSSDISTRPPRKWALAEDQKLREEVEAQLINGDIRDWCRIAEQLPGRSNKDCRKRWHNSVAGGLEKGQWSKSEDQLLYRAVEQHGQRWTLVASCIDSRSADQCAKRWQQSLDPELDRSEWRELEDRLLLDATQRLGRHWKDIQREHFPGRSKNDIKNRYTVLVRRYQNQGITLPSAISSPSESSTPIQLSSYHDDDDFVMPIDTPYNGYLSAPTQATTARSRHSWSDADNETYATWSTSDNYDIPMAIPAPEMYHATITGQRYAATNSLPLASQIPTVSIHLDWSPTRVRQPSSSTQDRSQGIVGNLVDQTLHDSGNYLGAQHPIMAYDPTYTGSTAQAPYSTMLTRPQRRSPSSREQQDYAFDRYTDYSDPRYPHNHPYGY